MEPASTERSAGTDGAAGLFAGGRGRVLLFCWFGWVFDLYDLVLFGFCKGALGGSLGLAAAELAWIEGLMLFSTAVGGFLCGRFADRAGRRPALVACIVLFSAGALATGLAQGFWSLLAARLVTGLGVGGEWGIGHALIAEHWRGPQRDRVHGLLQAGSPVAMALAAAVAFFVAPLPQVGWRAVFVASAGLGALALWARAALPGPDRAVAAAERLSTAELWSPVHRRASAVLLLVLVLHMAGFWCVYAELPAALIGVHHVPAADVGWFQIRVNAVHVVADVAFGALAARYGRRRMFVLFCLVFAAGHAVVLLRLGAITDGFGAFTLAVAAMGLGAGTWSCFGALFGELYPPALRATAASTFYCVARAVQLPLKPALAAAFAAAGSFAPALWIGIGCALGSALAVSALPRPGYAQRSSADAPGAE